MLLSMLPLKPCNALFGGRSQLTGTDCDPQSRQSFDAQALVLRACVAVLLERALSPLAAACGLLEADLSFQLQAP